MIHRKTIFSSFLAVGMMALVSLGSANEGSLKKIADSNSISLGYRETSIPFSYLDGDQKPIGFSMDLCNAVADEVKNELKLPDLKVDYAPVNASNRIPLLQNGTIDIECASTANFIKRQAQADFSYTIFVSQARWMTKTGSGVVEMSDLAGKTIVMTQGSGCLPIVQKLNVEKNLGLNIIQAKDHAESLLTLRTGRAMAWFEEDILLASLRATSPEPAELEILPDSYATFHAALMLRKDDPTFKALIDRVIADKMASGAFEKL